MEMLQKDEKRHFIPFFNDYLSKFLLVLLVLFGSHAAFAGNELKGSGTQGDIDGDGRADYAVWRPSNTTFYTKSSASLNVVHREVMGTSDSNVPLTGDVDGNGIDDLATWDPTSGIWTVTYDDGSAGTFSLGQTDDYPFLADRDGDGKDDPMVRRPSEGRWYYLASAQGYELKQVDFGREATDVPVLGYYDEDDRIDFAIWRDGTWYMRWSTDNVTRRQNLGTQSTDIMTPADYDGDGITDVAMWRPTNGTWYIYYSSGVYPEGGNRYERSFGKEPTDIPVPADYDGDGKADIAFRRPTTFTFYYLSSTTGEVISHEFGKQAADIPPLAPWQEKSTLLITPDSVEPVTPDWTLGDIDDDLRADFAIWRSENRTFYARSSETLTTVYSQDLGDNTDGIPLMGDVDGDDKTDMAVWNETTGTFHIYTQTGETNTFALGQTGDYPFLADRDGDGKDDPMVRRPSEGRWYYLASDSNYDLKQVDFGREANDVPVLGYYDDDDRIDFAIWRDGIWYMRWSTDNVTRRQNLGTQSTDIMAPADYDGDGTTDVGMWRPSTGTWYIYYSSGVYPEGGTRYQRAFGNQTTDIPVPADYDGDGKADLAIRRPTSGEFIYLRSSDGTVVRHSYGNQETDIPALAVWQLKYLMKQPATVDDTPPDDEEDQAAIFYEDNISSQIIQSRCVICHVSGGAADGQARLIFNTSNDANYLQNNQNAIRDFLALDDVSVDYFLSKASGGQGHIGGAQIPVGSDEYNNFQTYLGLLTGEDDEPGDVDDFWDGVSLLNPELTYRRASIILTGNVPTAEEMQQLENADDETLRDAVLSLMQGGGFHEFLLRGANDRLLTDKWLKVFLEITFPAGSFPEVLNINYENNLAGDDEFTRQFNLGWEYGFHRAPLELIAHVVENDLPYTEILTADYMMLNFATTAGVRGTADFQESETDKTVFKPGQISGYMLWTEDVVEECDEEGNCLIVQEGEVINWPHTGILNDLAWLNRYPTTATNRNRARSRWTWYHFLDFDIEKSAQRTTDADALRDTNNPTLNNPNCTVCHQTLDPVAGAYQDYGNNGWYKDQVGGLDSLPDSYKESEDSPYIEGDTWFRDMLAPGFGTEEAPIGEDSLRWLAQRIVEDPRFATSSVKFWWHSVMGQAPLDAPQEESDTTYQARFDAHVAQSSFISDVAQDFAQHWNLKQLLADFVMSPWFRANAFSEDTTEAQIFAGVGTRRLLTPEELSAKTKSLTGTKWGEFLDGWSGDIWHNFDVKYGEYTTIYGGIDSDGITTRITELTATMLQTALAQAAEIACPVIVNEFSLPQDERRLLKLVEKTSVPDTDEDVIKQQLVSLFLQMHGTELTVDSPEIESLYALFVEIWTDRQDVQNNGFIYEDGTQCDNYEAFSNEYEDGQDPLNTMATWRVILVFLMSDFEYLHE